MSNFKRFVIIFITIGVLVGLSAVIASPTKQNSDNPPIAAKITNIHDDLESGGCITYVLSTGPTITGDCAGGKSTIDISSGLQVGDEVELQEYRYLRKK
jgi:hypothetical protein